MGLDHGSAEALLGLGADLRWGFHGNPEAKTHKLRQIRSRCGPGVDPKHPNCAFTNHGEELAENVDQGCSFFCYSCPRPRLGRQQPRPCTSCGLLSLQRPGDPPVLAHFWPLLALPRQLPSSPLPWSSSACLPSIIWTSVCHTSTMCWALFGAQEGVNKPATLVLAGLCSSAGKRGRADIQQKEHEPGTWRPGPRGWGATGYLYSGQESPPR